MSITRAGALLVTTTLLLIAACAQDSTRSGMLLEPQFAGSGLDHRPFGGSCETSFSFVNQTTVEIESVCQLHGIGRVTGLTQQALTFTQTGILIENTTTYTTPSGDELHATFAGIGVPNETQTAVTILGLETYAGGTGRFANASGSAQLDGSANLVMATGAFTVAGTLTL